MGKITVKNISSAKIVLLADGGKFRRELMPGRVVPLSRGDYENLMYEPGVNVLLDGHYICFNGVEDEEAVNDTSRQTNVVTRDEIRDMLVKRDIASFIKFLPGAQAAEKDTVVELATELNVTDAAFVGPINKYCGVDIIQAIAVKHQVEEK